MNHPRAANRLIDSGPGTVTTPGPGPTAPGCWSTGGGHFLASHIFKLSPIISDVLSGIDSDILSDITSDILSDIESEIAFAILSDSLSDTYSDILSGITLTFYLT